MSLVMATATLYVYLLSQLQSADALFLIKSDNTIVNLVLVALAGGAVYFSFMKKLTSKVLYIGGVSLASLGCLLGLAGLCYSSIKFTGILDLLDYMMIIQLGVIYAISCLSLHHPPVNFQIQMPVTLSTKLNWLNYKLVSLLPKPSVRPASNRKIIRHA